MVADDSSLEIENLTATVSSNAVDKVEAIIYVNTGRLTVDSFTTPASVTGLAIGPNATASQISITDSNIGKIAIDETNKDTRIYEEILSGNTSDAEITTGFDVAKVEDFETIFAKYGYVRLTADLTNLTKSIIITNQSGTIDLNGHTITYGTTDDDLHTGVLYIEGGNITITGNGIIEATDGYHVSCIKITENGSVTIENGTFTCTQGDAIDIGVKDGNGGNAIINGGSFEGQEFCVGIWGNSNVTINDGSFTARDNAVIGTNGADTSNPSLTINGGTFTGNIISFDNDANAPYIACGIYMACNVDVTITAADFIINGGVGILLRGGSLDMQGGRIINNHIDGREKGVVGDSHVMLISDEAIVVDQRASDYPAANSIEIINNGGYDVVELDEEGNPITK